jgi:hypothetical protein
MPAGQYDRDGRESTGAQLQKGPESGLVLLAGRRYAQGRARSACGELSRVLTLPFILLMKLPNSNNKRGSVAQALLLTASVLIGAAGRLSAQETAIPDWNSKPVLAPDLNLEPLGVNSSSDYRPHRIRLFRVQPAFLTDPLGLERDDPLNLETKAGVVNDGADFVNVAVGNDNPYFDFRRRGDPGGLGYYRVHSQVQLFDSPSTALTIGLQAITPAGIEFDGLPNNQGARVVSPAFSLFQALNDEGTALQAFCGKHVMVGSANAPVNVQQNVQYGFALQHPLASEGALDIVKSFYLSVGALGQYRPDRDRDVTGGPPLAWDVLPGFHWQLADNWWVTGGVLVPLTAASRSDPGRWQVTCSFQF